MDDDEGGMWILHDFIVLVTRSEIVVWSSYS